MTAVIIAGSRTINDMDAVNAAMLRLNFKPSQIICGMADRGVDALAVKWAEQQGIPLKPFYAHWLTKDGEKDLRAGYKRNIQMAEYAAEHDGALVALWDGWSNGTAHMIAVAEKYKLSPISVCMLGDLAPHESMARLDEMRVRVGVRNQRHLSIGNQQ